MGKLQRKKARRKKPSNKMTTTRMQKILEESRKELLITDNPELDEALLNASAKLSDAIDQGIERLIINEPPEPIEPIERIKPFNYHRVTTMEEAEGDDVPEVSTEPYFFDPLSSSLDPVDPAEVVDYPEEVRCAAPPQTIPAPRSPFEGIVLANMHVHLRDNEVRWLDYHGDAETSATTIEIPSAVSPVTQKGSCLVCCIEGDQRTVPVDIDSIRELLDRATRKKERKGGIVFHDDGNTWTSNGRLQSFSKNYGSVSGVSATDRLYVGAPKKRPAMRGELRGATTYSKTGYSSERKLTCCLLCGKANFTEGKDGSDKCKGCGLKLGEEPNFVSVPLEENGSHTTHTQVAFFCKDCKTKGVAWVPRGKPVSGLPKCPVCNSSDNLHENSLPDSGYRESLWDSPEQQHRTEMPHRRTHTCPECGWHTSYIIRPVKQCPNCGRMHD